MRGNLFCKKRFPRTPSKKLFNKKIQKGTPNTPTDSRREDKPRLCYRKLSGTSKTLSVRRVELHKKSIGRGRCLDVPKKQQTFVYKSGRRNASPTRNPCIYRRGGVSPPTTYRIQFYKMASSKQASLRFVANLLRKNRHRHTIFYLFFNFCVLKFTFWLFLLAKTMMLC